MYLILDTGCQRTVAGVDWLKQARQELLERFLLRCDILTESRNFQFGAGGPEMSFKCIAMPVGVAGRSLQLRCSGVSSQVPSLGSRALLSCLGAVIGLQDDMVVFTALQTHLRDGQRTKEGRKSESERPVST